MQASSPNSDLKLINVLRYSLNMSLAKQPGLLNNITRVCNLPMLNLNIITNQSSNRFFQTTHAPATYLADAIQIGD